jgi:hypothetical protein
LNVALYYRVKLKFLDPRYCNLQYHSRSRSRIKMIRLSHTALKLPGAYTYNHGWLKSCLKRTAASDLNYAACTLSLSVLFWKGSQCISFAHIQLFFILTWPWVWLGINQTALRSSSRLRQNNNQTSAGIFIALQ